jgi:hypothetical protein
VAQKRSQTTQVNIRMTEEQRQRLDEARVKLVKGGVKVPLGPWLLSLGLAEADRVLGKKG